MKISLGCELDLSSKDVREFLFDLDRAEYDTPPLDVPGFKLQGTRKNTDFKSRDIEIAVAEQWQVEQRGNAVGLCEVNVTLIQPIHISTKFYLLSIIDVLDTHLQIVLDLFNKYNPATDGDDIKDWVRKSLPKDINETQFRVETTPSIIKPVGPHDGNIEQRLVLLSLYNRKGRKVDTAIHIVPDMPFDQWAVESEVSIRPIGKHLLDPNYKPEIKREIQEVKPGTSDASLDGILDAITAEIIPGDCGTMTREDIKLLSLAAWPEFKIEWHLEEIEIGCATIVINVPILKTRISNLNFYVYFALPADLGRTVMAIGKTCAIRSALGGAVIGVIIGNPAAALAAFNALFKMCIEREAKRCINPGILILKEAGNWA